MEIVKIAGAALVTVVLISLLKQYLPAYATLALISGSLLFLEYFIRSAAPVLEWAASLSDYLGQQEFQCLLKAAGIALITQNAQELCRDAGMNSLGTAVELSGRCLILTAALPLFQKIIERFVLILQ